MRYYQKKRWRLCATNQDKAQALASRLGVAPVVGQLLLNRGITDETAARQFLFGRLAEGTHDPFLLKGMQAAVERISAAFINNEKITIYGDYDVDGITATALLFKILRELGGDVEYYIPERQSEGYGLHLGALQKIVENGSRLLITVDCGISAWQEVAAVPQLDIIITDHHQPPETLPTAVAVINPKQPGCFYPEKDLAGVGVAFKLCQAVVQRVSKNYDCLRFLDIVAIGTVADMVSLTGENRLLVKYGIEKLRKTENIGLRALLEVCNLDCADVDAGKIAFVLAPRLNASGRLHHAGAGVELLTSADTARVQAVAVDLNLTNTERQDVERQILEKAEESLLNTDWGKVKALVVAGEGWHSGVIGIVASRLVERYHRPTVLISIRDGIGKGSCRSIPGFNLYEGLSRCSDLLLQFGGHHQAAGLSLKQENIAAFTARLNDIAAEILQDDDFLPVLSIDAKVSLTEVNSALVEQIACLEPFGVGNPSPLLVCSPVELSSSDAFGKEKRHLRLWIREETRQTEVIAWNKGDLAAEFDLSFPTEIAFVPELHEWQGRRSVRMRAVDVRQSEATQPDKQTMGKFYLLLKGLKRCMGQDRIPLDRRNLSELLAAHYQVKMDEAGIDFTLTVFCELGLVRLQKSAGMQEIELLPTPPCKVDIAGSATYRSLHK